MQNGSTKKRTEKKQPGGRKDIRQKEKKGRRQACIERSRVTEAKRNANILAF